MGNRASAAGTSPAVNQLHSEDSHTSSYPSSPARSESSANATTTCATVQTGEVAREMGPNEEEEGYWGRVQRMAAMMDVRKIFITHRQVEQVRNVARLTSFVHSDATC